jgi:hypothetical protein
MRLIESADNRRGLTRIGSAKLCCAVAPRGGRLAELSDVVRCQLQDFACQMAVGEPKFIQNREVIRLCDRDQVAGEMRL